MVENEYIDKTLQKAYLEGINGCVEHIQVLQQVIQDAKHRNKTVHVSWFDLADAFGSVSHDLIPICLQHYNVPEEEIAYIVDLYNKLPGKVKTKTGYLGHSTIPTFRQCLTFVQLSEVI